MSREIPETREAPGATDRSRDVAAAADEAAVAAWVAEARTGGAAAIERLVRRFERPVRVIGMRMLGPEHAEDLAQEVFFRMIQGLGGFRGDSRFSTWLFGIAYRTALDMRRRLRRPVERAVELTDAPEPGTGGDAAESQALRATVEWALRRVKPQHRDALVLHYLRELSLKEVAQVMNLPEATAKVYLFRGRQELYRILEREGGYAP